MTEGYAGMSRTALRLAREEPDQVLRLQEFRVAHPQVIIGDLGFGVWQACIPEPHGEHVISRYTLRELLNKLDKLTERHRSQPDSGRTIGTSVAPATDGAFWTAQRWCSP